MCMPEQPPQGAQARPAGPARNALPQHARRMNAGPPEERQCHHPRQTFRVRVRLYQDRRHVIGEASVFVENAPPVGPTDRNGLTGDIVKQRNRYRIGVVPPNQPGDLVCRCAHCRDLADDAKVHYWPRKDQEYKEQEIRDDLVEIFVDQVVRVKVGYPNEESVPGRNTVDRTWVRFYLPETKGAGENQGSGFRTSLGMTTDKGTLHYLGANRSGDPFRQGGTFDFILGPQPGGWHFARVSGELQGPAKVSVRLSEKAYAREGQGYGAEPLIPWTFYYWPTNAGKGGNTTIQEPKANRLVKSPLWAYDVWCGGNPRAPDSAFGWESNPENTHCNYGSSWAGHCNAAAAASILFKEPPGDIDWQWDDVARGNLKLCLNSEGLKLLATEYAGHQILKETLFSTNRDMVEGELAKYIGLSQGIVLSRSRGATRERADYAVRLFASLQTELGEGGWPLLTDVRAPVARQRAEFKPHAEEMARQELQEEEEARKRQRLKPLKPKDRDAEFAKILDRVFRNEAARPDEVWNQAIYFYEASYQEHPDAPPAEAEDRRAQDLRVTLKVYWNEDYPGTYDAATAVVVDEGHGKFSVTPRKKDRRSLSLWRELVLRLQFSNGGRLKAMDDRNNIESCMGQSGDQNQEFYVLRYLEKVTGVNRAQQISLFGNRFVDDRIFQLQEKNGTQVLQLRNRYPRG